MRLFRLGLASFICLITLNGCSSPFLPHNAVKYIPEFSHTETTERMGDMEQEENVTSNETIDLHRSYFSPESIKERYTQHIEDCEENDSDPLLDIVHETIDLMRQEGKTDDEITEMLTEKFDLTEEEAQHLLEQTLAGNSI